MKESNCRLMDSLESLAVWLCSMYVKLSPDNAFWYISISTSTLVRPCLYFYLIRVSHSAVLYLSVPASLKPLYIFISQSVNERVKVGV